jgi:hypothetical protein
MRFVLCYAQEAMVWMGTPFGLSPAVAIKASAHAEQRRALAASGGPESPKGATGPDKPLSSAEQAEWAALVEHLR